MRKIKNIISSSLDWAANIPLTIESRGSGFFSFCHLLIAAIFFSSFFLYNSIFIGSPNALSIPLVFQLLSKRSILDGNLDLWYPYGLMGHTTYLSSSFPTFPPENWPHIFLPEKYFFIGSTFTQFIYFWLIGLFAYLIFKEEFKGKKWAFFSSVAFQLSGYVMTVATRYSPISMQFYALLALYVVWTMHRRKDSVNFLFLTLALILTMGGHQVAHASFTLVTVAFFSAYRYFTMPNGDAGRLRHFWILAAAFMTSALIMTVRVLPVLYEMKTTVRGFDHLEGIDFKAISPLLAFLRLFNSELFGITMQDQMQVFQTINGHFQGYHLDSLFAQFFGILPALLVVWALATPSDGKRKFLKLYVVIVSLGMLQFEPFISIFKVIFPTWHDMSVQAFLPLAFCMVAGYAGKDLEEDSCDPDKLKRILRNFSLWIAVIVIAVVMVMVHLTRPDISPVRIASVILMAVSALYYFSYLYMPRLFKVLVYPALFLLPVSILTGAFLMLYHESPGYPIFNFNINMLVFSLFMLTACYIIIFCSLSGNSLIRKITYGLILPLAMVFIAVAFYPWIWNLVKDPPLSVKQIFELSFVGLLGLITVTISFITIVFFIIKKKFDPKLIFPVFFAILIFDLLAVNTVHKYVYYVNPFHKASNPYPPLNEVSTKSIDGMDLKNYRFNNSDAFLEREIGRKIELDRLNAYTNANAVYGIRTYGGQVDGVYRRTADFVRKLAPAVDINPVEIKQSNEVNERFLDMVGANYTYDTAGQSTIFRSSALSRFMLFKSFSIINGGEDALEYLKSPEFNPQKNIVLEEYPGINIKNNNNDRAEKLDYIERSTDRIELAADTSSPGIILFNDNFHPGWKVYVNGTERPVLHANYNFMAASIDAGKNKVVFEFKPKVFYYSLYATFSGMVLFLVILGALSIKEFKVTGKSASGESFFSRSELLSHKATFAALVILSAVSLLHSRNIGNEKSQNETTAAENVERATASADVVTDPLLGVGNALDGMKESFWEVGGSFPHWLQFDFDKKTVLVNSYAIESGNLLPERMPASWVLEGSNDTSSWVTLDSRSNEVNWKTNERRAYSFINSGSFRYYRLFMTSGGAANLLRIYEVELLKG